MTNIRNKRRDISPGFTNIKRIKKKCYEQLYVYKFDNFDEMDIRVGSIDNTIFSNYWYINF